MRKSRMPDLVKAGVSAGRKGETMNVAVIGTSKKENEKRVAIHPEHLKSLPERTRRRLFFERGYGLPFGMDDGRLEALTGNRPLKREELLSGFSAVIMPKPVESDLRAMKEGAVLWGWVHTVQQYGIAQAAVDGKLTLIAWERMYHRDGRGKTHVFQKNNEMAGYCGVQHALQLRGIDGNFGSARSAAVLSFGSVSRGAVYALLAHGFRDITVYTRRPVHLISDRLPGVRYRRIFRRPDGCFAAEGSCGASLLADELSRADIIVNGILQDPKDPAVFIGDGDIPKFRKECLVIDVSCDRGMGFSFARPTDFSAPMRRIGNILYYSVDHTPTLLWDSASWEISCSLLPYLEGFEEKRYDAVLEDAVDVREGVVVNKDILSFQHRSPIFPYPVEKREERDRVLG